MISTLEMGYSSVISPVEYQGIKNAALASIIGANTVEVGGKQVYMTPEQQKLYKDNLAGQSSAPNESYMGQVIMSDEMFVEAIAVNLKANGADIDIEGKTADDIFKELRERYEANVMSENDENFFPGISVGGDEFQSIFMDKFFSRQSLSEPITTQIGEYSADKAVHEMCKAMTELYEGGGRFADDWKAYCSDSETFKEVSAMVDTYSQSFRDKLIESGLATSATVDGYIAENFDNIDHVFFRAVQRNCLFGSNDHQIWYMADNTPDAETFVDALVDKLKSGDTSTDFLGMTLTYQGGKFGTIEYDFPDSHYWEEHAEYRPY